MLQPAGTSSDFTWSGDLGESDLRSVYDRCRRLRFTGRMQLFNEERSLEVLWLAGRPVESEIDPVSSEVPLFERGRFVVTQIIPDLSGNLGAGIEMSGPLNPGQVQRIYALCADYRLSADVHIERARTGPEAGGAQAVETASVRFTHGKVESASVDGRATAPLETLSMLSSFSSGSFSLRLRPLFGGDEAPGEAPLIIEKRTTKGGFDVTGTVSIPKAEERRAEERTALAGQVEAPFISQVPTRPIVMDELSAQKAAMAPSGPRRPPSAISVRRPRPSDRRLWAMAILIGVTGGVLAFASVLAWRRLPLWREPRTGEYGKLASVNKPAPLPAPKERPRDAPPVPPEPGQAQRVAAQAGEEPVPAQAAKNEGEAAGGAQEGKGREARSRSMRALVGRLQRLVLEGRLRTAGELLAQLERQAPSDPDLPTLAKQVRGELGRGEVIITGSGSATINEHRYRAPARLRLPGGLYQVDGRTVLLRDGEKLEVPTSSRSGR